jgi:endonuclease-3
LPTGEPPAAARRRARRIVAALADRYPNPQLPLRHENALQLLVATILSAQCTDAMVNRVTPALFARFRTAEEFARAGPRTIEALILPTGFYRQKARAIRRACQAMVEHFGGQVPATMDELLTLDGVGRKTANVILGGFHGIPGVVVDTHVRRLSLRLGLTASGDPERIEQDLTRLIRREAWSVFSLRLIFFGREVCTARKPACPTCPIRRSCPSAPYHGAPPWLAQAARSRRAANRKTGSRRGKPRARPKG